jgi:hypothetical protein
MQPFFQLSAVMAAIQNSFPSPLARVRIDPKVQINRLQVWKMQEKVRKSPLGQ